MNRAVAYLRVSTETQTLGLDVQRAVIERWSVRENVHIVSWCEDRGVSGGTPVSERTGLSRAIAEVATGGADVLVVSRRDRLARDQRVAIAITQAVRQCGARVVSLDDGGASRDSAVDEFITSVLDAAAAYERTVNVERTKAALAQKRARGERIGSIPLGHHLAADGITLEVDEHEQRAIALVYELRTNGMAMNPIAKELTARGVESRTGNPWNPSQVFRILQQRGDPLSKATTTNASSGT